MLRRVGVLLLTVWMSSASLAVAGIRCGNDLIQVGESSFEVQIKLERCGSLIAREQVASNSETSPAGEGSVTAERIIEQWYIRVRERGGSYCYPLTFEEGRLKEIGGWRRCD